MTEREINWIGSSKADLRMFPKVARRAAGFELDNIQNGDEPSNWRPMPSVGLGVREVRINIGGAFRVLYVVKLGGRIFVLHAFEKKTRKTRKSDLNLARSRFREISENQGE